MSAMGGKRTLALLLHRCRDQASGGNRVRTRAVSAHEDEEVYDETSAIKGDERQVAVKGPDQVDVKLTAEVAEETSDRRARWWSAGSGEWRNCLTARHRNRRAQAVLATSGSSVITTAKAPADIFA